MKKVLIKNIKSLVGILDAETTILKGADLKKLEALDNAWLAIEDGIIVDFGSMLDFQGITDWANLEVLDVENCIVMPTYVDSHTHIVFAANREDEFVDRLNGLSYQEIANRGGGILNSASKLAHMSEDDLYSDAMARLNHMISLGTGAIEIKSGYGLSLDAELKMLRVIKRIKETAKIPVKSTFLGAHAYPENYKNNKAAYVDHVINDILPIVAKEKLADYIDVFCEEGYFSQADTERILKAGAAFGLIPKVHANQLNRSGGVQAGVNCNAISVDHLEFVEEEEMDLLLHSSTMPTVLPGAAFFLELPYPPVRKMIEHGLPIALASDYNPGSCPCGDMNMMIQLACIKMKMLPEEAINAATINTAHAMQLQHELGSITRGKRANLIIMKPNKSINSLPYHFGANQIDKVLINGEVFNG